MDPIQVRMIAGRGFVFNAKDYIRLRVEHRMVGSLVGCVVACPRNSNVNGLPAILSPTELQLLRELKLIHLVEHRELILPPTDREKESYLRFLKDSIAGQRDQQCIAKVEESRKVLPRILEGKRKKLLRSGVPDGDIHLDGEQVLAEIRESCVFNADNALVQVPTERVRFSSKDEDVTEPLVEPQEASLDSPPLHSTSLKYRVFKDLWLRGKYVTNGDSFGGDFLVYPGDPMYFHASHIVHCCHEAPSGGLELAASSLVAKGRMAVLVNKLCVFVWEDRSANNDLVYQTMQWEGSNRRTGPEVSTENIMNI